MKETYLKIWMVLAPLIFAVSYFISSRVNRRMQQLVENDMNAASENSPIIYASIATLVFSLIYLLVVKDLSKKD